MILNPKEEELFGLNIEVSTTDIGSISHSTESDMVCWCNERKMILKRKSNDFLHFINLTFFILIISGGQFLCSASYSRRRPSVDWRIGERGSDSRLNEYNDFRTCLKGQYLKGYSLSGGTKAGRYVNMGAVDSMEDCATLCCNTDDCKLAILLLHPKSGSRNCFRVDCYDTYSDKCKAVISGKSKYKPYIFVRGVGQKYASDVNELHNKSVSNRKILTCHNYSGSVCSNTIDISKTYYYTTLNPEALDGRLQVLIDKLIPHLSEGCHRLVLRAICYSYYPQCSDGIEPKRLDICKQECNLLTRGDCTDEFQRLHLISYLKHLIPSCHLISNTEEDESSGSAVTDEPCIEISKKEVLDEIDPTHDLYSSESTERLHLRSQETPYESDYKTMNLHNMSTNYSSIVAMTSSVSSTKVMALNPTITSTVAMKGMVKNITATANSNIMSTEAKKNVPTPYILDIKANDSAGTNLAELDASATTRKVETTKGVDSAATTVAPIKITPHRSVTTKYASTAPAPGTGEHSESAEEEIRVSAGDNTVITLPENQVSLFASTWPKEKEDVQYLYEWTQLSAPSKSHGYIEGKNSKNVKLTKLDVAGVYTFKLTVRSKGDKKHGIGYVNITVKEPSHVNHPPRAEITPKEQTIQLPTDTVILDGSKSKDDVGIVTYKWEELKGPIKEKTVFASSTDSKILQLKNLVAGDYTFRLTVSDAEGETDKREATVTVKKEVDYPPKANAGNDVVIHLPNNSIILNGNQSTDDKNTLKFQWSKTSDSPTCDMQGTDKPQLKLSRLQEGTYVFLLKVTDSSGQSSEAKVKVIVLPEKNLPPVAIAGDDKELIYPDDSTTLDGSKSTDNSKIVSYKWEQVSGPNTASLIGANSVKVHLSKLVAGTYVMKLTAVDDKNVIGTDTVKIHVKKDHNENPVAVAGEDLVIFLPTRSVVIDGSKSHDDEVIEQYRWTRAGLSPAAGVVINGSDKEAVLRLTNLVKGHYIFDLTVTDNKGLTGTDSVTVLVQEDPSSLGLVELYLYLDIDSFSEESKIQLIRKISVILEVGKEYVIVEEITGYTYGKGVMILFYVKDPNMDRVLDGKYVADMIKQKVGFGGKLFEYTMIRVEPYICRNNCSDHGYCDKSTKLCVCDSFWTANFLKSKFGEKESNCDWSILYLSVAIFILFLIFVAVSWAVCFCFARKKRNKRRARYRALRTSDPDGTREEILLIPKGMKEKFSANSLTFTESDEDSDQETTVFDKKKLINGHIRMNGTVNGKISKYKDHNM